MRRRWLKKNFRRAAPDRNQPRSSRRLFEILYVGPDLLGQFHLVLALFDVVSIELLYIITIENRRPRLDRAQERLHLVQQLPFKYSGLSRRGIHVVVKRVPPRKNKIGKGSQRHEFLHQGRAAVSALAQANGSHLG